MKRYLAYWPIPVSILFMLGVVALRSMPSTYKHFDGKYRASVEASSANSSASGNGVTQKWKVQLDDGRVYWVNVPPAEIGTKGRRVYVNVYCRSESENNCKASLADLSAD